MFRPDRSKLKNATGQKYTSRLFLEQAYQYNDKSMVQYTLKDYDHPEGYKSLRLCYLSCEDPTEYTFAETYLDGWSHWKLLQEAEWFKPYVLRWREELRLVLKRKLLKRIEAFAYDPENKFPLEALKTLLKEVETLKPEQDKNRVGRPDKVKIKDIESEAALEDDLNRMNS